MTPRYAQWYNVVDSFDTHANIPVHFGKVDDAAKNGNKVGLISCGWDPGMFSLNRLYATAILPGGHDYTFWGRGVSQGHSDAIRRIDGVKMDSLEPKPSPAYSALKEKNRQQEAQIKAMQDVIADQQRMIEALTIACKIYGVAEKIERARRCR